MNGLLGAVDGLVTTIQTSGSSLKALKSVEETRRKSGVERGDTGWKGEGNNININRNANGMRLGYWDLMVVGSYFGAIRNHFEHNAESIVKQSISILK